MKLSILVCHLKERGASLADLVKTLLPMDGTYYESLAQNIYAYRNGDVEVLIHDADKPYHVGRKRNDLIAIARGEYVCHVDDDDKVALTYTQDILAALKEPVDCVGICGIIKAPDGNSKEFRHSIQYSNWYESGGVYYRSPNHLNPIIKEIAEDVGFAHSVSFGEDRLFSNGVKGMLKSEVMIEHPIYYYTPSDRTGECLGGAE